MWCAHAGDARTQKKGDRMNFFQRFIKSLSCMFTSQKKRRRRTARALEALRRAVCEALEPRTYLTALYWNGGSSGTWDGSTANWNTASDGSGSQVAFNNGDSAIFTGTSSRTITVSGSIGASSVSFSGSGVTLAGSGSISTSDFGNT